MGGLDYAADALTLLGNGTGNIVDINSSVTSDAGSSLTVDALTTNVNVFNTLGGTTTIQGDVLLRTDKKDGMYRTLGRPDWKKAGVQFVPYFAWSNRGESEMTVWLPIVWQ